MSAGVPFPNISLMWNWVILLSCLIMFMGLSLFMEMMRLGHTLREEHSLWRRRKILRLYRLVPTDSLRNPEIWHPSFADSRLVSPAMRESTACPSAGNLVFTITLSAIRMN